MNSFSNCISKITTSITMFHSVSAIFLVFLVAALQIVFASFDLGSIYTIPSDLGLGKFGYGNGYGSAGLGSPLGYGAGMGLNNGFNGPNNRFAGLGEPGVGAGFGDASPYRYGVPGLGAGNGLGGVGGLGAWGA